jgi:hypothetical protein
LEEHLQDNPCLLDDWLRLWDRLRQQGWCRLERRADQRTLCYHFNVPAANLRGATAKAPLPAATTVDELQQRGLLPGQQLFVSKLATIQFIARFPYLLQNDEVFTKTLTRLGWQVNANKLTALWEYSVSDLSTGRWEIKPRRKGEEDEW